MQQETSFPEVIIPTEGTEKIFLFLSQKSGKKKEYELMKATPNGVEPASENVPEGEPLPVYIRLLVRYINLQEMKAIS